MLTAPYTTGLSLETNNQLLRLVTAMKLTKNASFENDKMTEKTILSLRLSTFLVYPAALSKRKEKGEFTKCSLIVFIN